MFPKQFASWLKIAPLLALAPMISGCIFFGEPSESRGVKLSEAMASSAKGDHRDLSGSQPDETHYSSNESETTVESSGFGLGVSYDKTDYAWQVPMDVTYELPLNGDIKGLTHFRLTPISWETERNYLGLYAGGAIVEFDSGSLPDLATRCPWTLETGVEYRCYLNHPRTFLSPYLTARLGYELLAWRYRNPIVVDGDTIHGDFLSGVDGYVGFGISTMRDKPFSFFGEIGLGGTLFWDTTNQGFDNDVFDDFGFVSFKVGLAIKF